MDTPLHLCIATGQNAANLIPLKQLQAQRVVILETPEMKRGGSGNALKTALGPYVTDVVCRDFQDDTPQSCVDSAVHIASDLDGQDVIFHITGGTKLMVLAIHEQLKLLNTGAGRLRVLYADTKHQSLSWMDDTPHQTPMQDVLTLNDVLLVQGYRSTNDTRPQAAQQQAEQRVVLTRQMGDHAADYGRFFSALATVAGRAKEERRLQQAFEFSPGGRSADLLEQATRLGLVEWHRGQADIRFRDESSATYFAGMWAEEYVFLKMAALFKPSQYALNTKIKQVRSGTENEIDAMAVHKNRALIVECKTSRQVKAQEAIYKLGQIVRQVGGLMAQGVYVSAQALSESDLQRAKEYHIQVFAGEDLKKISDFLRTWKTD
jgi:hypothetical protein